MNAVDDAAPRRARTRRHGPGSSALPLGVIAVTFFLPFTTDCNDHVVSPLDEASKSFFGVVWIAPPFIAAALLCVVIVHAILLKETAGRLTLLAGLISLASSLMMTVLTLAEAKKGALLWAVPILAVPIFVRAWRRRGMRRLVLVIDTYVVSTFSFVIFVGLTACRFYGALVFLGAYGALLLLRAWAHVAMIHGWRRSTRRTSAEGSPSSA